MDDRTMLAAMALQGLTAKYGRDPFFYLHAVECADALLARLAETAPDAAPQPEADGAELSETVKAAIKRLYASVGPEGPQVSSWEEALDIARAAIAADRAERLAAPPHCEGK